ncbi:MAG: hypothetical protein WBF94_06640 [Gordonia sp. (in: high G+C Gram-positive bacteria)]
MKELKRSSLKGVSDQSRFGELVERRRGELGINQSDVPQHGGPSDLTVRKLERGRIARPSAATFSKLDTALQWAPGSARAAFHGGEPVPLSPEAGAGGLANWRRLRPPAAVVGIDQGVVLRTDALAEILRLSTALDSLQGLSEGDVQRITDLRHALDRVIRAWVIRQAEIAKLRGGISDLTIVLDDQLRTRPTAVDPEDLEDLRYLRWLAGYEVDDLTNEDGRRFSLRFETATE